MLGIVVVTVISAKQGAIVSISKAVMTYTPKLFIFMKYRIALLFLKRTERGSGGCVTYRIVRISCMVAGVGEIIKSFML